MSAVPAARFLAEFGAEAVAAAPPGAEPDANRSACTPAELEEAFARGVEEGQAAARAECDVQLEEQRGQFAAELEAARQEWVTGACEQLAGSLLAAVSEFEVRIAETVARILKPFVTAQVHTQAVAELRASLDVLVSADPGVTLNVSGPEGILDAVREHLDGKAMTVTYEPSDGCDARIVAGQATLETRLEDWMAKLEEAMR
jgi:hypothetical protein